jgi:hypothetical protein
MNDYALGALEALTWAWKMMADASKPDDYHRNAIRIHDAIMKLCLGGSVAFGDRIDQVKVDSEVWERFGFDDPMKALKDTGLEPVEEEKPEAEEI